MLITLSFKRSLDGSKDIESRRQQEKPPTRAGAFALACTLLIVAALPSVANPEIHQGGTLRISFFRDSPYLVSLDPFQVYWIEHRAVLRNVAESLTDQDPVTGKIIPWLAKSWEISQDALEYTFVLREDVTFSDGEHFDAESVKTAFDADKAFLATLPSSFGAAYLEGYHHTDVIDGHTVKIVLSHPNAGFLQATSTTNLAILAPESYKRTAKERSLGAIIGTGPFILKSYTPEVGIKLLKRKGYAWPSDAAKNRGEAYLDAVDITYVLEESVRNGQFLEGATDIVWPREPFSDADLNVFKARKASIASRSLPGPAFDLYPNLSNGRPLADADVRLALQKAIDRKSLAKTAYNEDYPIVESVYDVTTPYFKSQKDKLVYDPEGAALLLDKAGWKSGKNGYRYKDGKQLSLALNLFEKETTATLLLQDQLRKVGIELKLNMLVIGEWLAANNAGRYDLMQGYLTRADPIVLQNILDPRFVTSVSHTVPLNAYTPETLAAAQKLFDAGLLATDTSERARAYGDLQNLLIDNGVVFPVHERVWQAALSNKVQGFAWTAEGFALLNDVRKNP